MRAARLDRVQTSLNLAYGSALASIGLTIPAVAECSKPTGEPMASTLSPTLRFLLDPSLTVGRPVASSLSTAVSLRLSEPMTVATNSRRSLVRTMTSSAPSTTW